MKPFFTQLIQVEPDPANQGGWYVRTWPVGPFEHEHEAEAAADKMAAALGFSHVVHTEKPKN